MNTIKKNHFARMQKITAITLCVVFFMVSGCGKQKNEFSDNEEFFYYYFGEKIFLKQVKDKIYLNLSPYISEEQYQELIRKDASLRQIQSFPVWRGGDPYFFAALETKDGNQIPLTIIDSFNKREEVVSVEYMYLYNGHLQGLTNKFVIKLKETTTYAQLHELAEQYHCTIGEENLYVKNQFPLYVCKNSNLNAMLTANLFQESGLFEFAAPSFALSSIPCI